jgi:hypothetical protein
MAAQVSWSAPTSTAPSVRHNYSVIGSSVPRLFSTGTDKGGSGDGSDGDETTTTTATKGSSAPSQPSTTDTTTASTSPSPVTTTTTTTSVAAAAELKKNLRPSEIVDSLNRHIVGQYDAKRAVAIAMRNRWRRRQLPDELRKEVTPRNVLLVGPTG